MVLGTPESSEPYKLTKQNLDLKEEHLKVDDPIDSETNNHSVKIELEPKTDLPVVPKSPESKISPTRPRRIQYKPKSKPKPKACFRINS